MIEMTDERAAEVLAAHNEWRRYDGETGVPGAPEMGDPTELGRAIDHAVDRLRSQPPAEAQPVAWQFQDREGEWHGFVDERHRQNTIADGSWPIRALYAAPPSAPVGVEELVRDLVREIERNTCAHEDTYRGGAIWEICRVCGAEWADDRGGKPDFKWPDCVERAHAWLAQQPAAVDGAWLVKARELYDRCSLFPENTTDGFMALLELRNHVHSILAAQPGGSDNDR